MASKQNNYDNFKINNNELTSTRATPIATQPKSWALVFKKSTNLALQSTPAPDSTAQVSLPVIASRLPYPHPQQWNWNLLTK